jgi:hypothetical protein
VAELERELELELEPELERGREPERERELEREPELERGREPEREPEREREPELEREPLTHEEDTISPRTLDRWQLQVEEAITDLNVLNYNGDLILAGLVLVILALFIWGRQ